MNVKSLRVLESLWLKGNDFSNENAMNAQGDEHENRYP